MELPPLGKFTYAFRVDGQIGWIIASDEHSLKKPGLTKEEAAEIIRRAEAYPAILAALENLRKACWNGVGPQAPTGEDLDAAYEAMHKGDWSTGHWICSLDCPACKALTPSTPAE